MPPRKIAPPRATRGRARHFSSWGQLFGIRRRRRKQFFSWGNFTCWCAEAAELAAELLAEAESDRRSGQLAEFFHQSRGRDVLLCHTASRRRLTCSCNNISPCESVRESSDLLARAVRRRSKVWRVGSKGLAEPDTDHRKSRVTDASQARLSSLSRVSCRARRHSCASAVREAQEPASEPIRASSARLRVLQSSC